MTYKEIKTIQAKEICIQCIHIYTVSYSACKSALADKSFAESKYHFRKAIFYLNRAHKVALAYRIDEIIEFCVNRGQDLGVHFPSFND